MTKQRESNFELLRIIAMFMVLALHANFFAIGGPDIDDFHSSSLSASTRLLLEMMSIVSVNVFVMISGWFGIKPSLKGFANFLFQCLFFLVGIYAVGLLSGYVSLSAKGVASCLTLSSGYNWFIRAYLGLYVLSPILNTFLQHCSKRQLEYVLISFYTFQTIYGVIGCVNFISNGYSTFSFIGLYLLSRYLRLYGMAINKSGVAIYAGSVLCNCLLYYALTYFHITRIDAIGYANPLVVMGAMGLIMWTAQLRIQSSRLINFIAASSFAVYLLHTNPNICYAFFRPLMISLYEHFDGLVCLSVEFVVLLLIFALAVLLDQPRKWLWNCLWKKFENVI